MRGAILLGAVHISDGVALRPTALDREREDAVQEVQMVLDGLRGQSVAALALEVLRDLSRPDLVDWTLAEERHEVAAQVSAALDVAEKIEPTAICDDIKTFLNDLVTLA